MADRSKIEWTDASWNPVRARALSRLAGDTRPGWHCEHVSEGCRNCYAESFNKRLGNGLDYKPGHLAGEHPATQIYLDEKLLLQPLRWKRPRKIFVGSMTDVFADFVSDEMLDKIFAVAALCPQHTFQFLTKRPARMRLYLNDTHSPGSGDLPTRLALHLYNLGLRGPCANGCAPEYTPSIVRKMLPLPNVWLGVSCEDQASADARIPDLLSTPAVIRFISAEPLLGPIDLNHIETSSRYEGYDCDILDVLTGRRYGELDARLYKALERGTHVDQVIVGGESGPNARPMHADWARSLRDQCANAGVAFFFKQWGEHLPVGQTLPGLGKIHGASAVRMGRMKLHYGGTPTQAPQHAFADRGVEFNHTADGRLTFRVGKHRAGRLLDGAEHNTFPEVAACRAA